MINNCISCGKEFKTYPCKIKKGRGKFCSHRCYSDNLKNTMKGKGNPFYGKNHSLNSINKIVMAKEGSIHTEKTKAKMRLRIGDKNGSWKGGRTVSRGYIYVHILDHPHARKNYIAEHRLVVEQQIGRYLLPKEEVHHLERNKKDNTPSNLIAFINKSAHLRFHWNPENVKAEEIIFDGRKHIMTPVHTQGYIENLMCKSY